MTRIGNLKGVAGLAAAIVVAGSLAGAGPARADRANSHPVESVTNLAQAGQTAKKPARHTARRHAAKVAAGKASGPAHIVAKVKAHARAAGVPVLTALAIVKQESGFRPHVTGSAGEIGLMQLKCSTARGMGFSGSCKSLYDPDTNLRFGMRYLKRALARGSVAYYNAGIHAKSLPHAARRYAQQVASRF